MQEITRRQIKLLRCIIQSYIHAATPISSDHVVRQGNVSCSPATIRNEMANLESMGFLYQPHTSAGRVPTDKAYRFYVDSLMRWEKLTAEEQDRIRDLAERKGDVHSILEQASIILGQISNELAVVLTPFMSNAVFDRLELISLSDRKVLVILHVRSRSVKTIILQIDSDLKQEELFNTASILNERLSGLSLEEIKNEIRDRFQDKSFSDAKLLRLLIDSAEEIFDYNEPLNMRTFGTNNILSHPEFSDKIILETLFEIIEDRRIISTLLQPQDRPFRVMIGQENTDVRFRSFSVISARYQIGPDIGSIGIIGPKRMRYSKIVPLVDKMARTISVNLS